jgi:hypothetical protein
MADWLIATSAPSTIHVAIEVPHGPIVETLLERGFNVYASNPKQLDRFRDRFSPAGAKDDSRDAEVQANALRTDMRAFREVVLADAILVELREWSRMADGLTTDKNRLANRLREQLWRYYPQMGSKRTSQPSGCSNVIRRPACHPRLRNAVYHSASAAIQYDDKSRAKY